MNAKLPAVTWVEAINLLPGQRQHSLSGPRTIDSTTRLNARTVLVVYTDGTSRMYFPHEDLPILGKDA